MAGVINEIARQPIPQVTRRNNRNPEVPQPAQRNPLDQSSPNRNITSKAEVPTPTTEQRPASINTIIKMGEAIKLSPDRLLCPDPATSLYANGTLPSRSTTKMPAELPTWLWYLLAFGLGISRDKLAIIPKCVSLTLWILTIISALCFAACGLILNAREAISEHTRTTALVAWFKSAVGVFWVLLGLYSHSLAVRSFSSKGLLDFIRLHAKTFMKISTAIWITVLGIAVIVANLYSVKYLLKSKSHEDENTTDVIEPKCHDLDVHIAVCHTYYYSKIITSSLNLAWILAVSAVCLSVCRTHAVCMRRFMKELCYDSKIFEEFNKLKLSQLDQQLEEEQESFEEYDIHHDEIFYSKNIDLEPTSNRKKILDQLRKIRGSGWLSETGSLRRKDVDFSHIDGQDKQDPPTDTFSERGNSAPVFNQRIESGNGDPSLINQDGNAIPDLLTMKAPILSNADLMYTYFKIVKHLSTTSRLLQRWMSSSVVFVAIWSVFLVLYWAPNTIEWIDVFQFLGPMVVLGLLISAYAEVNHEGHVLPKYILPTEDRISVLYYVHNRPLELKVYSFALTFNILATFVAGITLTFASRIILDKVT